MDIEKIIRVNSEELDVALEKVDKLVELLKEAKSMANDLASKPISLEIEI